MLKPSVCAQNDSKVTTGRAVDREFAERIAMVPAFTDVSVAETCHDAGCVVPRGHARARRTGPSHWKRRYHQSPTERYSPTLTAEASVALAPSVLLTSAISRV